MPLVVELLWQELVVKYRVPTRLPSGSGLERAAVPLLRLRSLARFARRMLAYNRDRITLCWRHLCYACSIGARTLVLYGDGMEAKILCVLSRFLPLEIRAVCPFRDTGAERLYGRPVRRLEELAGARETIMCASFLNTAQLLEQLAAAGVKRERVIVLN